MFQDLRECWNGRQARLRCVWFRRVGSSPISRTKKERHLLCLSFFGADWDSNSLNAARMSAVTQGCHFSKNVVYSI